MLEKPKSNELNERLNKETLSEENPPSPGQLATKAVVNLINEYLKKFQETNQIDAAMVMQHNLYRLLRSRRQYQED